MKRRSFLRTVVGVLLAPLGLLGTVRVTEEKTCNKRASPARLQVQDH